jgi:hypothetical protein
MTKTTLEGKRFCSEDDFADQDVIQHNINFASITEQSLCYDDILDGYPIDSHDDAKEARRNWRQL